MNSLVGILWSENWSGFSLSVVGSKDGFRSIVEEPWESEGRMCKAVYPTQDEAQKRCWGMVRMACELKALQAAERMKKGN